MVLLEGPHRQIKLATEDLTDEQLYYQPTADTNSIAWLVWHLSRWRDHISATISGESQVWSSEGWAQRYGLPSELYGVGRYPQAGGHLPGGTGGLFGYLDAAHRATVERVAKITPQQFVQPMEYLPGATHPTWRALLERVCGFLATYRTDQLPPGDDDRIWLDSASRRVALRTGIVQPRTARVRRLRARRLVACSPWVPVWSACQRPNHREEAAEEMIRTCQGSRAVGSVAERLT